MPASANDEQLGGQVRAAVGRLYRRFRSERPAGSLGDAALDVLTYLHKHGPQTLTGLSEQGRVSPALGRALQGQGQLWLEGQRRASALDEIQPRTRFHRHLIEADAEREDEGLAPRVVGGGDLVAKADVEGELAIDVARPDRDRVALRSLIERVAETNRVVVADEDLSAGRAATAAVVKSTFLVILADVGFTTLFYLTGGV